VFAFIRKYEILYIEIRDAIPKKISELTGCNKPCNYKKYSYFGYQRETNFKTDHFVFSLVSPFNDTKVETKQLIYPLSSLVAEFGGTLGLFLGFSFMALWDGLKDLVKIREFRN
jgi:hypothetical protein